MITINNVSYRRSFYDRVMIKRFLPFLTHMAYAQKRDIPKNNSLTLLFRGYNSLDLVSDPLDEGITPTASALSVTDLSATLQQYGAFVEYSDVVIDTVEDPFLSEVAQVIGENAGQSLDAITREVLVAGSNVQFASTATERAEVSAAMTLDLAEVREAVRTMKTNNVPKITSLQRPNGNVDTVPGEACYIAFVHPNTTFDLKADPDFIPRQNYPSNDTIAGEVGRMDEVRFIESTFATPFDGEGAAGVDVYATLIIGADSYGVCRVTGKDLEMIIRCSRPA
ncbi:MAG: N4-gp56 family major capsid protein [Patescibacteria group bacterium]